MILSSIRPGQIVYVHVPWGGDRDSTYVKAKVLQVRDGPRAIRQRFEVGAVTVEWIDQPPIPGGYESPINTFHPDAIYAREPWVRNDSVLLDDRSGT